MEDERKAFEAAGCDNFLAKPVSYTELVEIIEHIIGFSPEMHGISEQ